MLEIDTIKGQEKRKCDICGHIRVPDARFSFKDEEGNIYGELTLCYKCTTLFSEDIGHPVDRSRNMTGFISFE